MNTAKTGRRPHDGDVQTAVLALRGSGLSGRKIAAALQGRGMAIGARSVDRILARHADSESLEEGESRCEPQRCACGAKITIMPCRGCKRRKELAMRVEIGRMLAAAGVPAKRLRGTIERIVAGEPLALELAPAQQRLLQDIRRTRRAAEASLTDGARRGRMYRRKPTKR